MSVLITSMSGFIASQLCNKLAEMGVKVYGSFVKGEQTPKYTAVVDITSRSDWKYLKKHNVDKIFHIMANNNTLDTDRDSVFTTNVRDSMCIFNKALHIGIRKMVFCSTTAVYGDSPAPYIEDKTKINPLNVYAQSKATLEGYASYFAKTNEVNMVGLRLCNVYGQGEDHKGKRASMIYQLYRQMRCGQNPRIFNDGNQKRDWIYVDDVCRCLLKASRYDGVDIFNCGSGVSSTFNYVVKLLNKQLGTNLQPEYIVNENEKAYQAHTECDMTKTKEKLGFISSFNLQDGIKNMVNYYQDCSL